MCFFCVICDIFECFVFFFSSRRRHTRWTGDWSSDVCSSDLYRSPRRRPAPSDASAFAPILMAMDCHVCGSSLPDGARFCPSCGALVTGATATDERKMVTVLFADLVDSTGLSQRLDAERAREVLGRFYDVTVDELHALRGRPEKFIGDAVMAVFGLPQVHEDDAVRAVRAGLAIRERTRRLGRAAGMAEPLEVRVGVESGVAATGLGPSGQLLVTGPVVIRAARLQNAAIANEVLVGETTHQLTM